MLEFLLSLGFVSPVEAANASPVFERTIEAEQKFGEPSFTSGT
jgi:hypothetical protein